MWIRALVLAAGTSTRMGRVNKLTADLHGKPIVARVVDALLLSRVDEIVVATGHEETGVRDAVWVGTRGRSRADDIQFLFNPNFASGMASSIAAGVPAPIEDEESADGLLICLGDMPGITSNVVNALISSFMSEKQIVVPTHAGRRGHPVLFGSRYFPALRKLVGDGGARALLADAAENVVEVESDEPGILWDVDTPEDLAGR